MAIEEQVGDLAFLSRRGANRELSSYMYVSINTAAVRIRSDAVQK